MKKIIPFLFLCIGCGENPDNPDYKEHKVAVTFKYGFRDTITYKSSSTSLYLDRGDLMTRGWNVIASSVVTYKILY